MCKYCDVRMPDGCGFELRTDRNGFETLIYPDGKASVSVEDACGNRFRGYYHFNYCPMCGKPLGDDTDELLYLVRSDCYEYRVYDTQNEARECAEEIAAERGDADVLTVAVVKSNACTVRCCWDDE